MFKIAKFLMISCFICILEQTTINFRHVEQGCCDSNLTETWKLPRPETWTPRPEIVLHQCYIWKSCVLWYWLYNINNVSLQFHSLDRLVGGSWLANIPSRSGACPVCKSANLCWYMAIMRLLLLLYRLCRGGYCSLFELFLSNFKNSKSV